MKDDSENAGKLIEDQQQGEKTVNRSVDSAELKAGGSVRVAVDAMGGDNAPQAIVEGVVLALKSIDNMEVVLVGDEETIQAELLKLQFKSDMLSICHAAQAIAMEESPSQALRKKRNSSIHLGIGLVKDKKVDAFISAGNTGAVMAVSTVVLRTLEGIDRAAIAVPLPTRKGHAVIIDGGANISCKAIHLYQFGVMGATYAEYYLDDKRPKVGLLSIGEEDSKGNEVTKETFELLTRSSLNFVGNTEAKQLYRGATDVIVCDGFTGNIAIKTSESLVEMIVWFLKKMFTGSMRGRLAYMLLRPLFEEFKKRLDHSEVGGAPLLGIDGAVFISHGSSTPKSIHSALVGAKKFIVNDVNGHIRESLASNEDIMGPVELPTEEGLWGQMKRKIGIASSSNEESKGTAKNCFRGEKG